MINKFYLKLFAISTTLTFLLFSWTLFLGDFFSDDFTWLWHGKQIDNDILRIATYRMSSFYSPVMNSFYSALYSTIENTTWIYFFAGLIVHLLNSFLTGLLTFQLTYSKKASILSTLFFCVVGTAYEPIVWVASNMHSIVTFFILSSVISYIAFLKKQKVYLSLITFLFFLAALGTKEVGIVIVPLLFATLSYTFLEKKELLKSFTHVILILAVLITSIFYSIQQFIWQRSGITVLEGVWEVTVGNILKLPIVIVDVLVPFFEINNNITAVFILVISLMVIISASFKMYKNRIFLFGCFWTLVSVIPTIFFTTEHWWGPLASRYTYLPRVGIAILVGTFTALAVSRMKRRVVILFIVLLFYNLFYWSFTVNQKYPYVYATGKTLKEAISLINVSKITTVYVAPNRPFESNNAYIVGAFETRTELKKEDLIFLKGDAPGILPKNSAILIWDAEERSFQVDIPTTSLDIK